LEGFVWGGMPGLPPLLDAPNNDDDDDDDEDDDEDDDDNDNDNDGDADDDVYLSETTTRQ
jgi:hypothetical protein